MSLNELEQGMNKILCPTDSRFRPDIRKLEQGNIDGAAIEKTRLEEKQRDASKQRKSKKTADWTPKLVKDPRTSEYFFTYLLQVVSTRDKSEQ